MARGLNNYGVSKQQQRDFAQFRRRFPSCVQMKTHLFEDELNGECVMFREFKNVDSGLVLQMAEMIDKNTMEPALNQDFAAIKRVAQHFGPAWLKVAK